MRKAYNGHMSTQPILSVNMRRCNAAMHALLNTNASDFLLAVQEPWFDKIGINRKDNKREGVDILGGAKHPNWDIHYPYTTNQQRAKVITYTRRFTNTRGSRRNPVKVVIRNDLARHPTILITDLHAGPHTLQVINFYHDVADNSSLDTLTSIDLDSTVPTLLCGDFNLHSPSWSPEGLDRSPKASQFEKWAAGQTFELQTSRGTITRQGREGERSSTLDLTWFNLAATVQSLLTTPEVDWPASIGSDHAGVWTIWTTQQTLSTAPTDTVATRAFKNNMTTEEQKAWRERIADLLYPLGGDLSTPTLIDEATNALQAAVEKACTEHMGHKKPPGPRPQPWWNEACTEAVQAIRNATNEEEEQEAAKQLTKATRLAKRSWADEVVTSSNVWEVAKWRHGRKISQIAALRTEEGQLTFDTNQMANILATRFFNKDPGNVQLHQSDDPEPLPTREFHQFTHEELGRGLDRTSNTSAPGISGISWAILKNAWKTIKDHMTEIANACLTIGYHPIQWRRALVVAIPKPERDDYSLAKNYRPISLLECMSKLIEKAMSKRFLYDVDQLKIIPMTQFGTRAFSCTLDAGLTLTHDVQTALAAKMKCGALLFDIKGFFDNVHKNRLAATLRNLGYSEGVTAWTLSFLSERRATLSFNGLTTPEQDQPVGTPQGSPLSPVLSALYTSPMLKALNGESNTSLAMYVDDGIIFARGPDWETVNTLLMARYQACEEWLWRNNLACKPEKTELIYFRRPRAKDAPPDRLFLPDPPNHTYYRVSPKATIQYLGFFINHKLDWMPHVDTMCNRARASLKALQVLGNTHRGLSMANWRLVFNAVCLPVLSYGCQLWATAGNYKTLTKKAQMVFNEGVKVISGAFRTAPREALHELTRVLPARHFFDKLTHTSALRLYRVPPTSQLLARLGPEWGQRTLGGPHPSNPGGVVAYHLRSTGPRRSARRPTALEALGERVPHDGPTTDIMAVPPWEVPNWEARLNHMGTTSPKVRKEWVNDLYGSIPHSDLTIITVDGTVSKQGRYDDLMVGGVAAILTTGLGDEKVQRTRRWCLGTGVLQHDVDLFALANAAKWIDTYYTERIPPRHIYILSRNSSALKAITKIRAPAAQPHNITFHTALTAFCSRHRDTGITLVWSPVSRDREQDSTVRSQALAACTHTPRASLNRVQSAAYQKSAARKRAFARWAQEWKLERRKRGFHDSFAYEYALTHPPNGNNHPLWMAAVKKANGSPLFTRHTTSTAFRLAVGHAFTSDYTRRLRPDIPEQELHCPCGFPDNSFHHIMYDCPRYNQSRRAAAPLTQWDSIPPHHYFRKSPHTRNFLDFLQQSRAAFKPPNESVVPFDPG